MQRPERPLTEEQLRAYQNYYFNCLRDVDRHLELEDRREGLEDDRVDPREDQGIDLLGEREPGQAALRSARDG